MAEFLHDQEWVEVPDGVVRLIRLAALTAARDAVAALTAAEYDGHAFGDLTSEAALAAIDALRGDA